MSRSPIRDLLVGVFVLSGLAALAYLSIALGGAAYSGPGGLVLYASFDEIGGLAKRSPVVIGGVKVGQVTGIELAKDGSFRARVRMDIDRNLKLPDDTQAAVLTQGVLGNQYVGLSPGGSETFLAEGGEIAYTQSAVVIERLIGKVIQSLGNGSSGSSGGGASGDGGKTPGGGNGS
jgi:phospholipid/cholesterol/gamma-HCH transport system substrate-binding protein